jgi:hypothetical protein
MNMLKPALTLAFLLGALLSPDAWAQHGHGGGGHGHFQGGGHNHFHGGPGGHGYYHGRGHGYVRGGIIVGAPLYWPRYGYLDPYYYYTPGYYVGAPWYLSPGDAAVYAGPGTRRLYYCDNPRGYYPNVDACLVPWRVVIGTVVPPP